MNLNQLNNKKIFIHAYNDYGLKLKSYFKKIKLQYTFKGFIDKNKELSIDLGYNIFKPKLLQTEIFDYILITSPVYYDEIYSELIKLHIPKAKILNGLSCLENTYGYNLSIDKIKQLKNKHLNEKCFIIGTGPSLTIKDLEKLSNQITFGANGLFLGLSGTTFRPTYYSICDNKAMEYFEDKVVSFFDKETTMLFPKKVLKVTHPVKNGIYYQDNISNKTKFDLVEGIYTGATVIYNLISIAIYMGIKEIYLIGLDFNYEFIDEIQSNHFIDNYPEDKNKATALIEIKTWIKDFKNLKNILKNTDIKIYNATRGGKLEVFPRVNFDDIIGENK